MAAREEGQADRGARRAVLKLPSWARRAVEEEAERLAEFLGGPLELSWK